VRVETEEY